MRAIPLILTALALVACKDEKPAPTPEPPPAKVEPKQEEVAEFIGDKACASCHSEQTKLWTNSHHDLALQQANPGTVLGDFSGVEFKYFEETATFRKDGDKHIIEVMYRDGTTINYEVVNTFGVEPLQQYLVKQIGGRLQASSYLWDTRPKEQGGQRWYHLYPDEYIERTDPLHWTQIQHNWNSNCAECHSTGVDKGYDQERHAYDTKYAVEDVSCEACHGPGSLHVKYGASAVAENHFIYDLKQPKGRHWQRKPGERIASLQGETKQNDSCAPCHARRIDFGVGNYEVHDRFRLALLEERLYFADGQIKDEVFVQGSFLQSRMHHAGVTCVDCHDPHTLKTKGEGNALCGSCHDLQAFGPTHTMHEDPKLQCVDCHMPKRTYMGVDARGDHQFAVPRPQLSSEIGAPNACNGCHTDKTPKWAQAAIDAAKLEKSKSEYLGIAFHQARLGQPRGFDALALAVSNPNVSVMDKATAASMMGPFPTGMQAIAEAAEHKDPLVRQGAMIAAGQLPPQQRMGTLFGALSDPSRGVRMAAVSQLFGAPIVQMPKAQQEIFNKAIAEFEASHKANADRPESLLALSVLELQHRKNGEAAANLLKTAIDRYAWFTQAYINLSDIYHGAKREDQVLAVLEQGLKHAADKSTINHALGLAYVRLGQKDDALKYLKAAYEGNPAELGFGYVYVVALKDEGKVAEAKTVVEEMAGRFVGNPQVEGLRGFLNAP